MTPVRTVGLVGGGVIGAGWAARLMLNGIDVALFDPAPDVERRVGEVLVDAERAYRKLTLAPLRRTGRITCTADLETAVTEADFIQESAPEREPLKRSLLAEVSRACRPEVVIASSTSGLLPSRLQAEMEVPERFVMAIHSTLSTSCRWLRSAADGARVRRPSSAPLPSTARSACIP